ncbi:MAG: dihydrodipicolinate synthase family protein [Pseudomonadota bacterium]
MTLFHGLSAFPITPCDTAGVVDTVALQRLIKRLDVDGVHSIGLLGSTGTYAYLDRKQRRCAVVAAKQTNADKPMIVGAGALRTDATCALAADAQAAGADALLIAPVSYTPLTSDEVFAHFETVAAETDLPICIYNNPSTTHFNFDIPLLQRLAALPNITAVKMPLPAGGSVADDLAALRIALPGDFVIGYSGDFGCCDALRAGADSWFSVIGGTFPTVAARLTAAAMDGDENAALAQNAALAPLWALFRQHGGLRVVYAIANHLGLTDAEPPLPVRPLHATLNAQIAEIATVLSQAEKDALTYS